MSKFFYIANIRLPTEKAHGIQITKTCEAFAHAGVDVELIVPRRLNLIKQDPFEYYDAKKKFTLTYVPCIDLVRFGRVGFWVQSLSFSVFVFLYLLFRKSVDVIYSRDELQLLFAGVLRRKIFWEVHTDRFNVVAQLLLRMVDSIIVISNGLKDFYVNKGVSSDKILVAPDGVDIAEFQIKKGKEECRKELNIPIDKKIVLYTGHLYNWKGVQVLADAAKQLKDDELVVFVGGTEKDIKKFKKKNIHIKNILIVGYRNHCEIPCWLKAADVVVLPNNSEEDISRLYTSPMKLFEYMASGTPIVASDLPSVREILNEKNAILVQPDSSQALSEGISRALSDREFAHAISSQALLDVEKYTWESRVKSILDFIK